MQLNYNSIPGKNHKFPEFPGFSLVFHNLFSGGNSLRRSVYLYQVSDNQECMRKYAANSVAAQTAVGPVTILELIDKGIWNLKGVHGPESFAPDPFVERLTKYEFPAGFLEMDSEYAEELNRRNLSDLTAEPRPKV